MPSPSGKFGYQGEFDIYAPDSAVVPCIEGGGRPLLGDIKTTKNLKYAKSSEALKTDTQAQLYGTAIMIEELVDELDAVWWYVRTQKPHRVQRTHSGVCTRPRSSSSSGALMKPRRS